jgi:hypothetical protein
MYQGFVSAFGDAASWLQAAFQAVPIFQLSIMTWVMFIISGCLCSTKVFNVPEQSDGPLSKTSLQ